MPDPLALASPDEERQPVTKTVRAVSKEFGGGGGCRTADVRRFLWMTINRAVFGRCGLFSWMQFSQHARFVHVHKKHGLNIAMVPQRQDS